jgi:uncharacterized protein with HEPN domain
LPSEVASKAFNDILAAIALIQNWIAETGPDGKDWLDDTKTRNAVERQLLIISEAAVRIHRHAPDLLTSDTGEVDWPGVRGIGNFLRHRYDDLDHQVLIGVVRHRLEPLRRECLRLTG